MDQSTLSNPSCNLLLLLLLMKNLVLGALLVNANEGIISCLVLEEIGNPQPPSSIHCNSSTSIGIANDIVKKQYLRSMKIQFFWIADKVAQKQFTINFTQVKKILQTTSLSITPLHTMSKSDHTISTSIIP